MIPVELLVDSDVIAAIESHVKESVIEAIKHFEDDADQDKSNEIVIGLSKVMTEVAVLAGMNFEVLLGIVRGSFGDSIEKVEAHEHSEQSECEEDEDIKRVEDLVSKKNIN